MRTSHIFLGVFALALILPLLLACGGSDEPTNLPDSERFTAEPTNLPDSERSTDEPAGRASSGQTTPAPPTESAEPSPTPRATAALSMAQTSPETDREALVALYNATDGPNWNSNNNWLSDVLISEWEGVTTDDNGRVTGLSLFNNQLSGEIPPDLGNLTSLRALDLTLNDFQGEIPPELGNLVNLQSLWIFDNRLSGCVPTSLRGQLETSTGLGALTFC